MPHKLIGLLLFVLVANGEKVSDIEMSESECTDLGLNRNALKCSACDLLPQFNLDEVFSDCKRCCIEDRKEAHEKYPSMHIEYCECNIQRFPQINAFIKGEMSQQWGNKLRVKHVRGTLPTIVLKNADGQPQKTLNIERWDTNTVTQFIDEWLE